MKTEHPRTSREAEELAHVIAHCFAGNYETLRQAFLLEFQHLPGARPEYWRIVRRKGKIVAHVGIYEKEVRIGCARLRMGGLGFVGCLPEFRRRGLAARCMVSALELMRQQGIPLALLFGKDRYYPRFGFVGCFPKYTLKLKVTETEVAALDNPFAVRPGVAQDLAALTELYNAAAAGTAASVVRTRRQFHFACRRWGLLDRKKPSLFVFRERRDKRLLRAYLVWKDNSFWEAAMRPGDEAACAGVLAWLREQRREALEKEIVLPLLTPAHPLHAYALRLNHQTEGGLHWTGGGMGRIVDTKLFLQAVQPEFEARVATAGLEGEAELRLFVDGRVHELLLVPPGRKQAPGAGERRRVARVWCSQQALLQMVLGSLALPCIPGLRSGGDEALVRALFPPGSPGVYRLDGF
ncbi:MAG: GNAT family N-acetyltransferase [Planctomycetota bacterium]